MKLVASSVPECPANSILAAHTASMQVPQHQLITVSFTKSEVEQKKLRFSGSCISGNGEPLSFNDRFQPLSSKLATTDPPFKHYIVANGIKVCAAAKALLSAAFSVAMSDLLPDIIITSTSHACISSSPSHQVVIMHACSNSCMLCHDARMHPHSASNHADFAMLARSASPPHHVPYIVLVHMHLAPCS